MNKIHLLKHEDIEKVKWNSCVHYAVNGNIFGYWWYLRNTAKEWDALVEIDPENGYYDSVMPLFRRVEKEQPQLYVPDMVREAGIYSIHMLSNARLTAFLEAIPSEYQHVKLAFNEGTKASNVAGFSPSLQSNHLLYLNDSYEGIASRYSPTLEQRIDQVLSLGLLPDSNPKPEKVAELYRNTSRSPINTEENFHAYQRIMWNALHRGWGFASGIVNTNKELCASCFFLNSHNRILCLLPAANTEGREKHALSLLLDLFIRGQAGKPVVLDFNSPMSDWPEGLAASFGAKKIEGFVEER